MTSEEGGFVGARCLRFIAVALAALASSTQCRPETPPAEPLPEVRPSALPSPATWEPIDRDHDGVTVSDDACPTEAEDRDEIDDADGCPEADADGDGAVDEVDVCPTQPGRGARYGRGCPTMAVMEMPRPVILEVIYFDPGQTTVPKEFESLISDLATVMADPILHLVVEGYCDMQEAAEICEARAANVVAALAAQGVPPNRIVARGMDRAPLNVAPSDRAAARTVRFALE